MPNAMSTLNQSGISYFQVPSWAMSPNTNTGLNFVEIDFILHAPDSVNGIGYILGNSGSSTFSISVSVTNALRYVSGSTERILSADNLFVYGQRCVLRIEYNDTGVGATAWTRMLLNGNPVAPDWAGATQSNSINQAGRYSTTRYSPITIYGLKFGSSNPAAVGYEATWGPQGAVGTGVNWLDDSQTRNLTIMNPQVLNDSWWLFYSAGVYVRALLQKIGTISQIADAEVGTGKKPLVLLSDGTIKERVASEGLPLIYDPAIAGLRTIASNEILQI